MNNLREKLEQWAEWKSQRYADSLANDDSCKWDDRKEHYKDGASDLIPMVEKLASFLEKCAAEPPHFIGHTNRHGEIKTMWAKEGLADLEKFLEGK